MKLLVSWFAMALSCGIANAQVPHKINYQGYLTTVTGVPVNATSTLVFRLYDVASGGAPLYTETQSIVVSNGVFNAVIGSVPPLALAFDVPYFIGVAVDADPEMTPRQPLVAAPYSIRSVSAEALASTATVAGSQISGALSNATLPGAKVTGNVSAAQINGTLTSATLPGANISGSVPAAQVSGDLTSATMAGARLTGTVAAAQVSGALSNATLSGANITGTLAAAQISGTIGTAQIANNAVTQSKLSPLSGAAAGKVLGTDGTNLVWQSDANSGGTVTSVDTGAGLTGGPITAAGTIGLASTQLLPTSACATNQVPKWNGSAWACASDNDTNNTANDGRYFRQGGSSFAAPAILGTANNQPLDVQVNGARVMRYEPVTSSPNIIGGNLSNAVTAGAHGATIAGGGSIDLSEGTNLVTDHYGTVGGGFGNVAGHVPAALTTAPTATVGGGRFNTAGGRSATVTGGEGHFATGDFSWIGGGIGNIADGSTSMVPGGFANRAGGDYSFAAGIAAAVRNAAQSGTPTGDTGTFVWADNSVFSAFTSTGPNQFLVRATGGMAINTNTPVLGSTLTVAGSAPTLTLQGTAADGPESGRLWLVEKPDTPGQCAGGFLHYDGNANTFYIGVQNTTPCNVAADTNVFQIKRSNGFVGILGGPTADPLTVGVTGNMSNGNGAHLTGPGIWTNGSSRSFKEEFTPVDGRAVLARVVAMPIATWSYRGIPTVRHMGPVAEDFMSAFGLGSDERYIGTVDADGVALAAIQGLHDLAQQQAGEIAGLQQRVAAGEALRAKLSAQLDAQTARIAALEAQAAEIAELRLQLTALARMRAVAGQVATR